MSPYENHKAEYREEENQRRYEQRYRGWIDPRDPDYIAPEIGGRGMNNTFTIHLDGREARMIVTALIEKAWREKGLSRAAHHILADQIDEARHDFHTEAETVLTELYSVKDQIAATIQPEAMK
ncbi:hypothetical protein SD71_10605 [Cohnella kolymensis]|uniref:Uncharacterized protein n=1 Tax=Cohnella kolymensis TaxID=1590652 RepID=A0ABR5A4B5_9BACL|nr:hypothetical protein [Cohnella kolymensis]KIL35840.1 hypothetical protein SD71_10605 [Cohnella kolymensis]